MSHSLLPLWNKVIFVDWHGVLSRDPFWMSILKKPHHPLNRQLTESIQWLFDQNDTLVRNWMRGNIKTTAAIGSMQIVLDKRYKSDYLSRKLVDDCQLMRTNARLLKILREAQNEALVVLATDNMDCFFESFRRIQNRRRIRQQSKNLSEDESLTMTETVRLFDDVLCSSERGVLKHENPTHFFGDWLSRNSLDFRNALLLDDLEKNCTAFRSVGGSALRMTIKSLENESDNTHSQISSWLHTKT